MIHRQQPLSGKKKRNNNNTNLQVNLLKCSEPEHSEAVSGVEGAAGGVEENKKKREERVVRSNCLIH